MWQGEDGSVVELISNGLLNVGIAMAQNYRPKRQRVIDVFVAVGIPDVPPDTAFYESRGYLSNVLIWVLAKCLTNARGHFFGAPDQLL
jgi:hypothetical protein